MKNTLQSKRPAGVSLLETVLAVAVIAVAVPLALAAVGRAGITGVSARAESRAPGIAEWCRLELEAARQGRSQVLPRIGGDAEFPAGDGVLALAFNRDGSLLGKVDPEDYRRGVDRLAGEPVSYLAALSGRSGANGVVVTVRIEYPPTRQAGRRDSVAFHTILP